MKSDYKRYMNIGPGGMRCPCCAPAPGRIKKVTKRAAKRVERAAMIRQLEKESE